MDIDELINLLMNDDSRETAVLKLKDWYNETIQELESHRTAIQEKDQRINDLKAANSELFMRLNTKPEAESTEALEVTVDDIIKSYMED